jgi:hypothetical protein
MSAGCPSCGGDNLAAFYMHVWCDDCDWIDPARESGSWVDGDSITRASTGETWTRTEGKWWSDLGGEPKTDDHATKTLEYYPDLVTVQRVTPSEPVDRADRVAAAEDRAEQVAYDAARERRHG